MKITAFLCAFCLWSFVSPAQSKGVLPGVWETPDRQAAITIAPTDSSTFEGILSKYSPLRNSPVQIDLPTAFLHIKILRDVQAAGTDKWTGKIFNPKDKKEYACTIKMVDKDRIRIRGYVGIALFGKTEFWTRTAD